MPVLGKRLDSLGLGVKSSTMPIVLCLLVMSLKVSECQNRGSGEDYLQVTENRQVHGSWFTGSCEWKNAFEQVQKSDYRFLAVDRDSFNADC